MKNLTIALALSGLLCVPALQAQSRTTPSPDRMAPGSAELVPRDSFLRLPARRVSSATQAKKYSLGGVPMDFTEVVENVDVAPSLEATAVGWVYKKQMNQTLGSESYVVRVTNKSPAPLTTSAYVAVLVTAVPMSKFTAPPAEQEKARVVLGSAGETIPAPFAGNAEKEFQFFTQLKMPGGFGDFNTSYFSKRFEVYLVTDPIVEK
jgi:hypothetical protein